MNNRSILFAIAALAGCLMTTGSAQPAETMLIVGEPSCLEVLEMYGFPIELETKAGLVAAETSEQIDRILIRLRRTLQGRGCSLRFNDIFRPAGDSPYLPVTNQLLAFAPDGALKGVALHDPEGRRLGRFEQRVSLEEPGSGPSLYAVPFYYFHYRTDQDELVSSGVRLLLASYLVEWKDVADRWVGDTYSEQQGVVLVGISDQPGGASGEPIALASTRR